MTLATRAIVGTVLWTMWERGRGVQVRGSGLQEVVEAFNRGFRGVHEPLSEWLVVVAGVERAWAVAVAGMAVSALFSLVLTGLALACVAGVAKGLERVVVGVSGSSAAKGRKEMARRKRQRRGEGVAPRNAGPHTNGVPGTLPDDPGTPAVTVGRGMRERSRAQPRPWWALASKSGDAVAWSWAAVRGRVAEWSSWARGGWRGGEALGRGEGRVVPSLGRGGGPGAVSVNFPLVSVSADQGMEAVELRAILGGMSTGEVSVRVFARGKVKYSVREGREGEERERVPDFVGVVPGLAWGRVVELPFRLKPSTAVTAWNPESGMLVTRVSVAPSIDAGGVEDVHAWRDANASCPPSPLHWRTPPPLLGLAVERRFNADVGLRELLQR